MLLLGPEGRAQLRTLGRVGSIGVELAVFTILGHFGGQYLDSELGTGPWLAWIGLVLGLAAGGKSLYVLARKTQRELSESE
jgi:F0F1-type ATP synthase assembly protein I